MSIKILDDTLQNQIAAGEVLERPASALKEVLENSLDAGAKNIQVSLDGGGRKIVVQDDGTGIPANELELALTRHATSKIDTIDDLNSLQSFGFRGEALPSIASVSRLTLSSVTTPQENASQISVEFGTIVSSGPTALRAGTRVEINDLFDNVPARLKFMKTPATEIKRCQDVFARTALAHLQADLELEISGRKSWRFIADQDLLARLQILWPPQITEKLMEIRHAFGPLKMRGYIGAPGTAQGRADRVLFYVNNRPVHNKLLLQALRQGYKGRLLTREYPQAILFIEMPPEMVDVNAHPTKNEVRFRDEKGLFSFVLHALEKPLMTTCVNIPAENVFQSTDSIALTPTQTREKEKFTFSKNGARLFDTPVTSWESAADEPDIRISEPESVWAPQQQPVTPGPEEKEETPCADTKTCQDFAPSPEQRGGLVYLGQIADTYLILKYNDRLLLMDQHAAHERILFHRFRNQEKPSRSRLAIPLEIPLHPSYLDRLEGIWDKLLAIGFILERPRPEVLSLVALPSLLNTPQAKEFMEAVLQGKETTLDGMWAMLACRSAIKAGDHLMPNDVQHLLEQWLACPQKEFCPHGRPSVLDFGSHDLEKMFKRK